MSNKIKVTTEIELQPFGVPNYGVEVGCSIPFKFSPQSIDLKDIPADLLAKMCDDWRASVFKRAGKIDPGTSGDPHLSGVAFVVGEIHEMIALRMSRSPSLFQMESWARLIVHLDNSLRVAREACRQ